jgi:VWFA-related protein
MMVRTVRSLLALSLAFGLTAQELPRGGAEQVFVTAIEVVADVRDAKGRLPAGLQPSDFILLEDGVERRVISVEYMRDQRAAALATPAATPDAPSTPAAADGEAPTLWQNVLYFENVLSNGSGRITAAQEMMKHVDALVQMGTVDVVFANPSPTALVRNSRDAVAIRAALKKVAANMSINQLAAHRREFLREVGGVGSLHALKSRTVRTPGAMDMSTAPSRQVFEGSMATEMQHMGTNAIRGWIDQEAQMIARFRESLTSWLSTYRRHVPRNLLLVSDGFDLDPVEFYGTVTEGFGLIELRSYVQTTSLGESANRLSKTLAAGAWTTFSMPSNNNADGWVDDTTVSGMGRAQGTIAKRPNASPKAFLLRPHDPLLLLAQDTGGKVVPNSAHIASTIEGLDDRVKLTYQVDRRSDGKVRAIEVRAKDTTLKIRAPRFAASSTSEEMAETRALGLLRSRSYAGDLPLEAAIDWHTPTSTRKIGTLRAVANVDLLKHLLPSDVKGQFRLTLAVQVGREAIVVNRVASDYDVSSGVFRLRSPIELPAAAKSMVVVVEETITGTWGSARVAVP